MINPVQFASCTMTAAEIRYSAYERKALTVVFGLRKFRLNLLSTEPFMVMTDQHALRLLLQRRRFKGGSQDGWNFLPSLISSCNIVREAQTKQQTFFACTSRRCG